jgi:hypothetical protein
MLENFVSKEPHAVAMGVRGPSEPVPRVPHWATGVHVLFVFAFAGVTLRSRCGVSVARRVAPAVL